MSGSMYQPTGKEVAYEALRSFGCGFVGAGRSVGNGLVSAGDALVGRAKTVGGFFRSHTLADIVDEAKSVGRSSASALKGGGACFAVGAVFGASFFHFYYLLNNHRKVLSWCERKFGGTGEFDESAGLSVAEKVGAAAGWGVGILLTWVEAYGYSCAARDGYYGVLAVPVVTNLASWLFVGAVDAEQRLIQRHQQAGSGSVVGFDGLDVRVRQEIEDALRGSGADDL